jgi:hypothetical protein
MSLRTCWKATGAVACAVVLGLLTVQGSLALWSHTTPAGAGTVRAAEMTVQVKDLTGGGSSTLQAAQAQPLQIAGSPQELKRGGTVYHRVGLSNATDAGGAFDVRVAAEGPATISPASAASALSGQLQLGLATAAAGEACPTSGYAALPVGAGSAGELPRMTLAKGGAGVLCLRTQLASSAPMSVSGTQAGIRIALTAAQVPGNEGTS